MKEVNPYAAPQTMPKGNPLSEFATDVLSALTILTGIMLVILVMAISVAYQEVYIHSHFARFVLAMVFIFGAVPYAIALSELHNFLFPQLRHKEPIQ